MLAIASIGSVPEKRSPTPRKTIRLPLSFLKFGSPKNGEKPKTRKVLPY